MPPSSPASGALRPSFRSTILGGIPSWRHAVDIDLVDADADGSEGRKKRACACKQGLDHTLKNKGDDQAHLPGLGPRTCAHLHQTPSVTTMQRVSFDVLCRVHDGEMMGMRRWTSHEKGVENKGGGPE